MPDLYSASTTILTPFALAWVHILTRSAYNSRRWCIWVGVNGGEEVDKEEEELEGGRKITSISSILAAPGKGTVASMEEGGRDFREAVMCEDQAISACESGRRAVIFKATQVRRLAALRLSPSDAAISGPRTGICAFFDSSPTSKSSATSMQWSISSTIRLWGGLLSAGFRGRGFVSEPGVSVVREGETEAPVASLSSTSTE